LVPVGKHLHDRTPAIPHPRAVIQREKAFEVSTFQMLMSALLVPRRGVSRVPSRRKLHDDWFGGDHIPVFSSKHSFAISTTISNGKLLKIKAHAVRCGFGSLPTSALHRTTFLVHV
jgi:hypothetical protein